MKKLKKILYNTFFYITIITIIAVIFFVMIFIVMKLNVYALTGGDDNNICILIDPGHGAEDGGAVSPSGVIEKDVNLSISLFLRDYLQMSGYDVIMTREDDSIPATGDSLKEKLHNDFSNRLAMYNDSKTDVVISIHQNSFENPQYYGTQIFYSPNDERSEKLALCVKRAFRGLLQPDNQRDITKAGSNIYLLNNCTKPCILAECGFLSNPEECANLADEEYRRQVAFAIYCGIVEFL